MYLSLPPLPRLTFLGWEIEDRRSPWRISKPLITRRYLWWVLDFDFFCNSIMEISIIHSLGWYSALSWLHLLLQMASEKGSLPSAPHGFIFHLTLGQSVSSVTQSCPTLCHPMNRSTPGLPVHHKLLEFTQTHAHRVGDAIQPSHPLSSPSLPAPNPSQHQGLFQWVNSSHEMAKVLEFQLQLTLGRTPETVEILFFTVKWNNPFILCFPGTWGHSMNRLYQAGLSSKLQSL